MDELAPTPQLITPPLDTNSFVVDGVTYTATPDISVPRWRRLQKLEVQFGFDASFAGVWDATTQIKKVIDERKSISDIAYINEGLRRGLTNVDRNEVYHLHVVALWFNAPDENPIPYDHEAIVAKMNRWEAAGLGMGFLFAKAASGVKGFRERYLASTEVTPESSDAQ
jgi:hypothetical protein